MCTCMHATYTCCCINVHVSVYVRVHMHSVLDIRNVFRAQPAHGRPLARKTPIQSKAKHRTARRRAEQKLWEHKHGVSRTQTQTLSIKCVAKQLIAAHQNNVRKDTRKSAQTCADVARQLVAVHQTTLPGSGANSNKYGDRRRRHPAARRQRSSVHARLTKLTRLNARMRMTSLLDVALRNTHGLPGAKRM